MWCTMLKPKRQKGPNPTIQTHDTSSSTSPLSFSSTTHAHSPSLRSSPVNYTQTNLWNKSQFTRHNTTHRLIKSRFPNLLLFLILWPYSLRQHSHPAKCKCLWQFRPFQRSSRSQFYFDSPILISPKINNRTTRQMSPRNCQHSWNYIITSIIDIATDLDPSNHISAP